MEQISEMVLGYLIALLTLSKQKLEYKAKPLFSLGKYYRLICLEGIPFLGPHALCNQQGFTANISSATRNVLGTVHVLYLAEQYRKRHRLNHPKKRLTTPQQVRLNPLQLDQ